MAAPTVDGGGRSPLLTLGSLVVAAVGMAALVGFGHAELVIPWLGACGLGGVVANQQHQLRDQQHELHAKADTIQSTAQNALATANEVQAAVGPANGESLQQLLHTIEELEKYSHSRNHDILNALSATTMGVDTMQRQLAKIDRRLTKLEPKAAR